MSRNNNNLGRGETLLIVDDQKLILETTRVVLKDLNYRILTGGTGGEALKLLENHREKIDLVVTDADMRGLDGIALSVMLRERAPSTKVIVLSGNPLRERVIEILSRRKIEFVGNADRSRHFRRDAAASAGRNPAVSGPKRERWVIILSGGEGRRLRSLST